MFFRPIRPEDAPLLPDLFSVLSPTSVYYRFFRALKEISPQMLIRFTEIDYDREIALVALDDDSEADRLLGVARIIGDPDDKKGEFAVLVGDPWHGRGIGSGLLKKCLLIAECRGFQSITGVVMNENKSMLEMGKNRVLI
ncbi:MAG TPA: GNAT family N-acetyltransferase [Desulfatirhabdiaceae bacterium]|nr:GNAT family N-acetyltransferase [Desulfatirhabdiaceae bacterium]